MADFFSKLITSGVLADPADCFQVLAHEGMTVKINRGYAFIKGRFAYDNEVSYLTLEDAPTVSAYKRIDMIVLRNNYAERKSEILVKTGKPSANPVEPVLIQEDSGDYYELCLATIYINSHQTVISQANITDTRPNKSYCGYVTQLIDSIDASVLLAHLEAEGYDRLDELLEALASVVSSNGPWKNDVEYKRYSIVIITADEETKAYVAINDVPVGVMPPNMEYWAPITLKGDTGANGVVVPIDDHYCFQIEEGHLWLYYPENTEAPAFSIDESGHLVYEIKE